MVKISFEGTVSEVMEEMRELVGSTQQPCAPVAEQPTAPEPKAEPKADVKKPATKKAAPKPVKVDTLSEDEIAELRTLAANYVHSHDDGKAELKAWLEENLGEGKKVSDITPDKAEEFKAFVETE